MWTTFKCRVKNYNTIDENKWKWASPSIFYIEFSCIILKTSQLSRPCRSQKFHVVNWIKTSTFLLSLNAKVVENGCLFVGLPTTKYKLRNKLLLSSTGQSYHVKRAPTTFFSSLGLSFSTGNARNWTLCMYTYFSFFLSSDVHPEAAQKYQQVPGLSAIYLQ